MAEPKRPMLQTRRRAREVAMQMLFMNDLRSDSSKEKKADRKMKYKENRPALMEFARDRLSDRELIPIAFALYDGVLKYKGSIDERLNEAADNWRLNRMAVVERNSLRIGTYEILFAPEPVPPAVAIDEAIELARRFGSKDSPAFVNGVLDKVWRAQEARLKPAPEKTADEAATPSPAPAAVAEPVFAENLLPADPTDATVATAASGLTSPASDPVEAQPNPAEAAASPALANDTPAIPQT